QEPNIKYCPKVLTGLSGDCLHAQRDCNAEFNARFPGQEPNIKYCPKVLTGLSGDCLHAQRDCNAEFNARFPATPSTTSPSRRPPPLYDALRDAHRDAHHDARRDALNDVNDFTIFVKYSARFNAEA
ncbi:hypothetical protein RYX36_000037, partial [Vicia faba]